MIQLHDQIQDDCEYCEGDDSLCCDDINKEYGYVCSRAKGHEGDHIACGYDEGHVLAMWPQEIEDNA